MDTSLLGIDPVKPTADEERELIARAWRGDAAAMDAICRKFLAQALFLAKMLRGRMELDDAFGEAQLAIVKAVHKWDALRGVRFTTYVNAAICRSILDAESLHAETIAVPKHARDKARAEAAGRQITTCDAACQGRFAAAVAAVPARVDLGDEDSDGMARLAGPERGPSFGDVDVEAILSDVERLPERERFVLRARTGLDGGAPRTLSEVGAELGLTKERVRQVQDLACARLRERYRAREAG